MNETVSTEEELLDELRKLRSQLEYLEGLRPGVATGPRETEAVEQTRKQFLAMFEQTLDAVLVLDDRGRFVDCNPAMCRLLGYSREDLLRLNVWDVTPRENREQIPVLMDRLFSAGTLSGDYSVLCKGGTIREVEYRAVANVMAGLHFSIQRDVTDRKREVRAQQRYTKNLQDLARASLTINSARTPKSVAQSVTEAARAIIGSHLSVTSFTIDENWGQAIQCVSLSDKYSAWRDYHERPDGSGIYSVVCRSNLPMRLTQAELEAHPNWRSFGKEANRHVPLRGFLAAPLVDREGRNIGLVGLSDKYEGEFTADDEAILSQMAQLASVAVENAWLYEQVNVGHERMRTLSRQLLEIQESERRHLARELHDEIGQLLTGLQFALESKRAETPQAAASRLSESRGMIAEALNRVRKLSFDLRPGLLDQLGLLPALRELIERYSASTGVKVNFNHTGLDRRFASEVETAAYRIVQEALTNVARHARVAESAVRVWVNDKVLEVQVEDQGQGFDPEATIAAGRSTGLSGMRERVTLMGGQLVIASTCGGGTHVMAVLHLDDRCRGKNDEHYHRPGG